MTRDIEPLETIIHLTDTSLPISSIECFLDDNLDSIDVSSTSGIDSATVSFSGGFFNNLFNIWLSARGSCSQNRASEESPNIAAAYASLIAYPLSNKLAYNFTLSLSSMHPSKRK